MDKLKNLKTTSAVQFYGSISQSSSPRMRKCMHNDARVKKCRLDNGEVPGQNVYFVLL